MDLKYTVIYAKNDHKKRKVFQEGSLSVKPASGANSVFSIVLTDEGTGKDVCKVSQKDASAYTTGAEVIIGSYMVQVETAIETNSAAIAAPTPAPTRISNPLPATTKPAVRTTGLVTSAASLPSRKLGGGLGGKITSSLLGTAGPRRFVPHRPLSSTSGSVLGKVPSTQQPQQPPPSQQCDPDIDIGDSDATPSTATGVPTAAPLVAHKTASISATSTTTNVRTGALVPLPHVSTQSSSNASVEIDTRLKRLMRPHQLYGAIFLIRCLLGQTAAEIEEEEGENSDDSDGEQGDVETKDGDPNAAKCKPLPPNFFGPDTSSSTASGCDSQQLYTGAILADEMGLGKTLTAISVMYAFAKCRQLKSVIVCPASLVDNWVNEVKKWLLFPIDNILYLKSSNDAKSVINTFSTSHPNKFFLLITSYDLFRKHIALLNSVRSLGLLVADEGHRLKNAHGTKTITALEQCRAKRRLILSGTPVQNNHEELYSMVSFVAPGFLGSLEDFRVTYSSPIERACEAQTKAEKEGRPLAAGSALVRAAEVAAEALKRRVAIVMLRRTRAVLSSFLPVRSDFIVYCSMTASQREQYAVEADGIFRSVGIDDCEVDALMLADSEMAADAFYGSSTDNAKGHRSGSRMANSTEVLSGLLSLRQCCNVATQAPLSLIGDADTGNSFRKTQSHGRSGSRSAICGNAECGRLTSAKPATFLAPPHKKKRLTQASYPRAAPALSSSLVAPTKLTARSSKLQFLSALFQTMRAVCPLEKVVIVSNFMSALDSVGELCAHLGYPSESVLRLTGEVPMEERALIVKRFNQPMRTNTTSATRTAPSGTVATGTSAAAAAVAATWSTLCTTPAVDPWVLLLSAKAGGVGLNLIGASRLVMMDIDWNPATDQQAMGRIWREGQQNPVFIYRLICRGSIEEEMLHRQADKLELAGMVDSSSGIDSEGGDVNGHASAAKGKNKGKAKGSSLSGGGSKGIGTNAAPTGLTVRKLVQLVYPRYFAGGRNARSAVTRTTATATDDDDDDDDDDEMVEEKGEAAAAEEEIRDKKRGKAGKKRKTAKKSPSCDAELYDWRSSPDSICDTLDDNTQEGGRSTEHLSLPVWAAGSRVSRGAQSDSPGHRADALGKLHEEEEEEEEEEEGVIDLLARHDKLLVSTVQKLATQKVVLQVSSCASVE